MVARRYQVADLGQFAIADSIYIAPPTIQAANLTFSQRMEHSIKLGWTKGNGQARIVIAKMGSAINPVSNIPVADSTYASNASFGSGSQIGNNAYVVYNDTGSSVTVSGLPADNYCYFAVYEYNGTTGDQSYLTTSPATGTDSTTMPPFSAKPGSALEFDGATDFVNLGSSSVFSFGGSFTVEGWFKVSSFTQGWQAIVTKGEAAWRVQRYNSTNNLDFGTNGLSNQDLQGATNVNDGKWHFFAAVYNGTNKILYVDGRVDADSAVTGTLSSDTYPVYFGENSETVGRKFNGNMDEIRIWNVARTEQQVRSDMFSTIGTTQNGLLGYWQFNEGNGTSVGDSVMNNNGTILGTANWATSDAPVGGYGSYDASTPADSAGPSGEIVTASLTSPADSTDFLGLYEYGWPTDSVVTNETFPSDVDKRSPVVWGIFGVGNDTANVTLNYSNLSGIQNESTLFVLEREYADSPWVNVTGILSRNTTNHTFTATGVDSFSQFAIGSGADNSLPVQATDFISTSDAGFMTLSWKTKSEVNNSGFNILRQQLQTTDQGRRTTPWQLIASYTTDDSLRGLGTSSTGRSYDFTDNRVISGDSYTYKIQSVSTEGRTNDLTTLNVTVGVPKSYALYQNYPNPFNPTTVISYQLSAVSNVTLKVYDILGREVATLVNGHENAGVYKLNFNAAKYASGVYLYRFAAEGNSGQRFVSIRKLVLLK